jgi:hypothetical protein
MKNKPTESARIVGITSRKRIPKMIADGHYQVPVPKGAADVYFGEDAMASLDACLPTPMVLRIVEIIRRQISQDSTKLAQGSLLRAALRTSRSQLAQSSEHEFGAGQQHGNGHCAARRGNSYCAPPLGCSGQEQEATCGDGHDGQRRRPDCASCCTPSHVNRGPGPSIANSLRSDVATSGPP